MVGMLKVFEAGERVFDVWRRFALKYNITKDTKQQELPAFILQEPRDLNFAYCSIPRKKLMPGLISPFLLIHLICRHG